MWCRPVQALCMLWLLFSLPHSSLGTEGRDLMETLKSVQDWVLPGLSLSAQGLAVGLCICFPFAAGISFSDECLSKARVYKNSRSSLRIIVLFFVFLKKSIVFSFPPRSLGYLVLASWSPNQFQVWIPKTCGGDLKSNEILLRCSHRLCTIAFMFLADRIPL